MRAVVCGIPVPPVDACFFLDFDGTLVDFAATPDTIAVPEDLTALLQKLGERHDGALALVTGRALPDIDHHLAPLRLPTAALHGVIRRDASGWLHGPTDADAFTSQTASLRERLQQWVTAHPGLLLEDKTLALALHFRALARPPDRQRELQRRLHEELRQELQREPAATSHGGLEVLVGDLVLEVRRRGTDKGLAVEAFLAETPFAGRVPVYLGDDLADTKGMAVVESYGGVAIAVGDRIPARWRLPTPTAAREWLARCSQRGGHS